MSALAAPLGWLMKAACSLTGNYGLAICLFTLLIKILLLPLSLWTHANGIRMVALEPRVNALRLRYYGDKDRIAEEQAALYKQEHYSPFVSVIPILVQVLILLALPEALRQGAPGMDPHFWGLDLAATPISAGGAMLLLPLLSGLSALLLTLSQNRLNPLQAAQSRVSQLISGALSVGISLILGFTVPGGIVLYWIASNLLTIPQQLLLNRIIPPEKKIDYEALGTSRQKLADYRSQGGNRTFSREESHREKEDFRRFFSVGNKHLVFYSENSGYYKYFEGMIRYVLDHSRLTVHYVTSDPGDRIFDLARENDRIVPYFIGPQKLITLLLRLEADVVVMTMSDLGNYQYKRSVYSQTARYVYVFHYPLSTHLVLHTGALRHYDAILCVGEFQVEELRQEEALRGDPPRELILCGYGQLERLYAAARSDSRPLRDKPQILIAPSWQPENILDSCLDPLMAELLGQGFSLIIRPHPEYVKRYPERVQSLVSRYGDRPGEITLELDFSSNRSIYASDLVISDWSGTAYEAALATERPCVFIDTPPKINNPDYEKITVPPLEFVLRDQVGLRVSPQALQGLADQIRQLLRDDSYGARIRDIRSRYFANFGHSDQVAGQYLIDEVRRQVENRTRIGREREGEKP